MKWVVKRFTNIIKFVWRLWWMNHVGLVTTRETPTDNGHFVKMETVMLWHCKNKRYQNNILFCRLFFTKTVFFVCVLIYSLQRDAFITAGSEKGLFLIQLKMYIYLFNIKLILRFDIQNKKCGIFINSY